MTSPSSPVQTQERHQVIDVLRGFAILGILMANLEGWIAYALPPDQAALLITSTADHATQVFLLLFVENKFITLFCLLFGYGFGVIIERMRARGVAVVPFFLRRMAILLLVGLVHLGLWWGEILSTYALCGMLLLVFRNMRDRGLLITGMVLILFVAPLIQCLKLYFYVEDTTAMSRLYADYLAAIQSSGLLPIFEYNYKMVDAVFIRDGSQFRDMAEILGKFLLGYYVLRKNFLSPTTFSSSFLQKVQRGVLPIALLYLVEKGLIHFYEIDITAKPLRVLLYTFDRMGILSMSLFYAASVALLFWRGQLKILAAIFRPVGMMSLTNYLTHTVFYVVFFYGIGFGMIGAFHLQWMIPLALAIYSVQILFSRYWMDRMLYGPVEWLWRQASYRKRLPLARTSNAVG